MNIPGELGEAADLVTPVLRKVLDFMGVRDFEVGRAGGSLAVNPGKVWLEDHLEKYGAEIAAAARVVVECEGLARGRRRCGVRRQARG